MSCAVWVLWCLLTWLRQPSPPWGAKGTVCLSHLTDFFQEAQYFSDVYPFVIFSENQPVGSTVSERSVGETHLWFCYAVFCMEMRLTQYEIFLA